MGSTQIVQVGVRYPSQELEEPMASKSPSCPFSLSSAPFCPP